MAKLNDWLSNPNTVGILTGHSLVPKLYVSRVAPSAADMVGAANKETADGWPSAVVTRNTQRRSAQFDLYVGENGMTIGHTPLTDIAPSITEAVSLIRGPKAPTFHAPEDPAGVSALMQELSARWFETQTAANAFATGHLVGDPDLALIEVVYYSRDPDEYLSCHRFVEAGARADLNDEFLYVGFSVWSGANSAHNFGTGDRCNFVAKYAKTGRWKGIRGLFYTPTYVSSAWMNANTPGELGWALRAVWADLGFEEYLARLKPLATVTTRTTFKPDDAIIGPAKDFVLEGLVLYLCGDNPTAPATWWNTPRTLFEQRTGVWRQSVYAIGNPEFVNKFSVVGAWGADAKDGSKQVAASLLNFEWEGARLAELNPSMSVEDKAKVSELRVSTVVVDTGVPASGALSDLYVEKLYQQQDLSVGPEVFKKSEAQADGTVLPEMTFSQVIGAVPSLDTRIWHRILHSDTPPFDADNVVIVGSDAAVVATTYVGTEVVSTDLTFALAAIMNGAYADFTRWMPGLVTDPYRAIWGTTHSTLSSNANMLAIQAEFDEATVYGRGAPDLRKLATGPRTAMLMLGASLNRKQFSSYVVGACLVASNARRVLC